MIDQVAGCGHSGFLFRTVSHSSARPKTGHQLDTCIVASALGEFKQSRQRPRPEFGSTCGGRTTKRLKISIGVWQVKRLRKLAEKTLPGIQKRDTNAHLSQAQERCGGEQ